MSIGWSLEKKEIWSNHAAYNPSLMVALATFVLVSFTLLTSWSVTLFLISKMTVILLLWLGLAAVSVLSTKYLLTENYPFPYHLLLFHLIGTITLKCIRHYGKGMPPGDEGVEKSLDPAPWKGNLSRQRLRATYLGLYAICGSASLVCAYQALLHWPNLATLSMILSLNWQLNYRLRSVDEDPPQRFSFVFFVKSGLVALGYATIFVCELKLAAVGIIMVLLTSVFGALAGFLLSCCDGSVEESPNEVELSTKTYLGSIGELFLMVCAFCSTIILLWTYEGPEYQRFTMSSMDYLVLVVNIVTSAFVIDASNALFRPSPAGSSAGWTSTGHSYDLFTWRIVLSLLFAALVSTGAIFIPRSPSEISIWQYAGYSLATIALLNDTQTPEEVSLAPISTHSIPKVQLTARPPKWYANATDEELVEPETTLLFRLTTNPWTFVAISMICWSIVLARSILRTSAASVHQNVVLDVAFKPVGGFDVVVAQYDEPIEELSQRLQSLVDLPRIQRLGPRIIIYDKLEGRNESYLSAQLQSKMLWSSELIVSHLDNVGREGDTYLHHIVSRWDELASHTLFMQAEMHHPRASIRRIQDYLRTDTGFLSLQNEGEVCSSLQNCHDRYWSESPATLFSVLNPVSHDNGSRNIALTYKGQFVVSAARIRSHSRQVYASLLEQLRDLNSSIHAPVYLDSDWHRGQHDSLNAPVFGFTLERLWGAFLQCSPLRIALKCPTLISGMLRLPSTVTPQDCQCLDE